MRTTLFLLVLAAVAGAGVFAGIRLSGRMAQQPPPPPPFAQPSRSPYRFSVAAAGIIEAFRENISIAPHKPGIVASVAATQDLVVKPGDVLFTLDDREARARITSLSARLEVQRAALAAARIEAADAADQWKRVADSGARIVSAEESSRRRFAADTAAAQVTRLEAELTAADAELAEARTALDLLTVRAGTDGVVLRVNIRPGEYAPTNPAEPLVVLGRIDSLQVRADVDEQNAPDVVKDCRATAFLKGRADGPIPLRFVRIDPFVIPKRSLTGDSLERVDTRVLQVIFSIDQPRDRALYVGQQVDLFMERPAPAVPAASAPPSTALAPAP